MLWDLFRENAGNNPHSFLRLVSETQPAALNKELVREFLKHANDEQVSSAVSTFFQKMMKGDSFATNINNALFKKDADLMPGTDNQLYDNVVIRQEVSASGILAVEQGI